MSKTCTKCGETKPESEFSMKRGKPQSRCKSCFNEYYRTKWRETESYELHKARVAARNRRVKLESYGLTEADLAEPCLCECCGIKPATALDHCHVTGVYRGRLCIGCNTAIGKLGDNLEGVLKAVAYLQRAVSPHAYIV